MPEQTLVDPIHRQVPTAQVETRSDGTWLTAINIDILEASRRLVESQATLTTVSAIALDGGETELVYHYRRGKETLNLKTRTQQNHIASITPVCHAASWIEREIHDLYAVVFDGHPNLSRLIRPPEMPEGFFRDDVSPQPGGTESRELTIDPKGPAIQNT